MSKWIQEELSNHAQIVMGQSPDSRYYNSHGNGIKFLQGCSEFGERNPAGRLYCSKPSKIAAAGSILFSVRAPVGRVNIADENYCIGRGVAAIRPTTVSRDYLYQHLKYHEGRYNTVTQGSTFSAINSKQLRTLLLSAPESIDEQDLIANILTTVDSIIGNVEASKRKYERIRTGLMHDLLTKGIDEHDQIRSEDQHDFKDSPLGRIPINWEARELNSLISPQRPICYGILMPGTGFDGGIPVIKVKDIRNGEIDMEDLLLTDPRIDEQYARSRLQAKDLLLTIRGTVGRTAIVPDSLSGANITQDTARIGIVKGNEWFIKHYFTTIPVMRFIELHTGGVAVRGINIADVRRIPIAFPPLEEQARIVAKLDAIDWELRIQRNYLTKLRRLKIGLMHDLLSGEVPVDTLLERTEAGTLEPIAQ